MTVRRVGKTWVIDTSYSGWVVEGIQTHGPHKGECVRAVVESDEELSKDEARLFGAGQLRGMGFPVRDIQVTRAA